MDKRSRVLGGILGLCVGDALGVPVEGAPREALKQKPITGMVGYGTYNVPPGTWSDDSSLALCLAEVLAGGRLELSEVARRFVSWLDEGYWTPYGNAFDVGRATWEAIKRLKAGVEPREAGGKREFDNGNGSLMRILPLVFYLESKPREEQFTTTHDVSCLTHAHPRSQIACGIYIQVALNLLKGDEPKTAYEDAKAVCERYYENSDFAAELPHFKRILKSDVARFRESEIVSSGYVVHTLEASLWCLLRHDSYKDTVLAAVNLGGDTDTTGAVAGGLAGIHYGQESIPEDWVAQLARVDDITALCERLYEAMYGGG